MDQLVVDNELKKLQIEKLREYKESSSEDIEQWKTKIIISEQRFNKIDENMKELGKLNFLKNSINIFNAERLAINGGCIDLSQFNRDELVKLLAAKAERDMDDK